MASDPRVDLDFFAVQAALHPNRRRSVRSRTHGGADRPLGRFGAPSGPMRRTSTNCRQARPARAASRSPRPSAPCGPRSIITTPNTIFWWTRSSMPGRTTICCAATPSPHATSIRRCCGWNFRSTASLCPAICGGPRASPVLLLRSSCRASTRRKRNSTPGATPSAPRCGDRHARWPWPRRGSILLSDQARLGKGAWRGHRRSRTAQRC